MHRTRQKIHQIKTTWTEKEFAQLQRVAEARKMPLGVCVHSIVNEYFRTQLTRGVTLLLQTIAETKATHVDVIRLSLEKKLSLSALDEVVEQNALRRRDLAHEFLLTTPASNDTPETEEDEDEDEDEEDE